MMKNDCIFSNYMYIWNIINNGIDNSTSIITDISLSVHNIVLS